MIEATASLKPPSPVSGQVEQLEAPAAQRGIALIHAEQNRAEQRRLLAAGAGADFEDRVALVVFVLRQQGQPDLELELGEAPAQRAHLLLGHRLHVGVVAGFGHLRRGRELGLGAAQILDAVDNRAELAVFLRQPGELGAAEPRAGQRRAQLGMAAQQLVEARFECGFHGRFRSAAKGRQMGCQRAERDLALRAAVEIAHCRRAAASSSSPSNTAARAPIRSARRIRRARLPE